MPISSSRRQRVIDFATPKVADLVVVERVDRSKNVGSADAADETAYGTAHPDTAKFPNFKLGLIKNGDDEQGQFQLWYYIKDRANQDDYNWEFSPAGAANPRFDTVVRTYITLRTDYDSLTPYVGYNVVADGADSQARVNRGEVVGELTYMPSGSNTPFTEGTLGTGTEGFTAASKFDTSYILFEKKQVRSGDETLDSLYVVEQRVFVKRVPMTAVDTDPDFPNKGDDDAQGGLHSKEVIYHANEPPIKTTLFSGLTTGGGGVGTGSVVSGTTESVFRQSGNTFWGIDAGGIEREGKQLTDNWYSVLEREIIKTDGGLVSDYFTYQTFFWPPVFLYLERRIWGRRDGGSEPALTPHFWHAAYRGPTRMQIKTYWKKTPWGAPAPPATADGYSPTNLTMLKPMVPLPMSFNTPMFDIGIEPSLHADVTLTYTTGSDHPVWDFANYTSTFLATNYDPSVEGGWPDNLVISDTQKPFRGGYLREYIMAYSPTAPKPGDTGGEED